MTVENQSQWTATKASSVLDQTYILNLLFLFLMLGFFGLSYLFWDDLSGRAETQVIVPSSKDTASTPALAV